MGYNSDAYNTPADVKQSLVRVPRSGWKKEAGRSEILDLSINARISTTSSTPAVPRKRPLAQPCDDNKRIRTTDMQEVVRKLKQKNDELQQKVYIFQRLFQPQNRMELYSVINRLDGLHNKTI